MSSRAEREKAAYDEQGVFERSHGWHLRFKHVFECPNSLRNERLFRQRVAEGVAGARVLDIGCGDGASSRELLEMGAAHVLGIDVAETFIGEARGKEVPGRLEFECRDAAQALGGRFDLIFGRAILHHLDYRPILLRLYAENLSRSGRMVFMEPLGGNLLIRAFHALAPSAHTPDERSFRGEDLRWLRESFPCVEIHPINYLSFPAGLLSSLLFATADNWLLRLCDRVDFWLAGRLAFLAPRFRQAIVVIHGAGAAQVDSLPPARRPT